MKINLQIFAKIIPFITFILVLLLFSTWTLSSETLSSGDWYHFSAENGAEFGYVGVYEPTNLGTGSSGIWLKPILYLISSLAKSGINPDIIARLVFIIPGLIAAFWGVFLWVKDKSKSILLGIISALFMVLNTYLLTLSTGHLTLYSAINLIPLSLYFYDKYCLYRSQLKGNLFLFLNFITTLLISFFEIRIFGIYLIIFTSYIFFNFSNKWKETLKNRGLLSIIGSLLISIFWLLPAAMASSNPYSTFMNRELFGNKFLNINYALAITHPFWTLNGLTPFKNNIIIGLYWFIPILIIYLLWISLGNKNINPRKTKLFGLFAVLFIIGVFLTKQSGNPYSETYKWLFNNLPFFVMYREASKFFTLLVIGFIGMLGTFAYNKSSKVTNILLGITLFSVLINATPLISGKIGGVHIPTDIPQMYNEINPVIKNDINQFNTLLVPRFSRWSYYQNDKPRVSFSDLAIQYKNQYPSVDRRDYEIITQDEFIQLLTEADIKYVIAMDDEEFDNVGDTAKIRTLSLDRPDAYTTVLHNDDYLVLRNNYYGTNKNINLTREFFNLYRINLTNHETTFYLPVKYDPNWRITTNSSLMETFLRQNWLSNVDSKPNVSGLQEFNIKYASKSPGDLYIQYIPDVYHKVGLIISGVFFIIISALILFPTKNKIESSK